MPTYPECDGIQFISPKADEKLTNNEEIQVVWKSNMYTFVNGLDLYNEKGEFVKSLWKDDDSIVVGAGDEYSVKVKLEVPLCTPLPA
ncbi:9950_t:CDS:2, partial [Funneliformis caledonium]